MIVITGGAGFIGSVLLARLNQLGMHDILIVDELLDSSKWNNLVKHQFSDYIPWEAFRQRLIAGQLPTPQQVFHLGANSSTTTQDVDRLMVQNTQFSQILFSYCAKAGVPFLYASSAATYGRGEQGFSDRKEDVRYRPVNPYGFSKECFDRWALKQSVCPPAFFGLKFFNVYGPNEYHKGDQASLVFKAFQQITRTGRVALFKSHNPDFADGMQLRDFVYVKDAVEVMIHFMQQNSNAPSGLYNVGTGRSQSFQELACATFAAIGREPDIDYIDMPMSIRQQYQYFTEAELTKLREVGGFQQEFADVSKGVKDYVCNYLMQPDPYL